MHDQVPEDNTTSRRSFLQASTAAALASGLSVARSAHAAGSDLVRIALIGCGGRGTGADADALAERPCGQAGIAGSARLDDGVVLAGQSGVAGHLTVGRDVRVASKSAVYESVEAGTTVAGIPAVAIGAWRRQQALVHRLQELWRRLRALERRVGGAARDGEEGS